MAQTPSVNLVYATGQFNRKVAAAQADIGLGCFDTPVASERCDLMDIPTAAREIRKTEVPKCVRAETRQLRTDRQSFDCF
jgi:hypothetical protein